MTDLTNEQQVIAATLWGEARGEGEAGLRAVAEVIRNRHDIAVRTGRRQFGGSGICGKPVSYTATCFFKFQFSCWNKDGNESQRKKLVELNIADPADYIAALCMAIAEDTLEERLQDTVQGATFYKVTTLPWPKAWGEEIPPVCVIGHHSFYKLR